MNDRFLHIESYARTQMIEQIMALEGRGHPSPRAFRDELERESSTQLSHRLELLTEFPASPSLTETAGVIASTDTGREPGSAREKLSIGTRIRFLTELTAAADEDHPELLYCRKGELGEITGNHLAQGYAAKTDSWPESFWVYEDEFEIVCAATSHTPLVTTSVLP